MIRQKYCTVVRADDSNENYVVLESGPLASIDLTNAASLSILKSNTMVVGLGKWITDENGNSRSHPIPDNFYPVDEKQCPPGLSLQITTSFGDMAFIKDGDEQVYIGDPSTLWFAKADMLLEFIETMGDLALTVVFNSRHEYTRTRRSMQGTGFEDFDIFTTEPHGGIKVLIVRDSSVMLEALVHDLKSIIELYGSDTYLIVGE